MLQIASRVFCCLFILNLSTSVFAKCDFSFQDGHVYASFHNATEGGIQQFDENLNLIHTQTFTNIPLTTGIAFSSRDTFFFSGRDDTLDSVHLYEMNTAGSIVNSINLQSGTQLSGSNLMVGRNGEIYVGTAEGLVIVDSDFTSFEMFDFAFDGLATDLAMSDAGSLYITDTLGSRLEVFDADRNHVDSLFIGATPVGLDFDRNDVLHSLLANSGQLVSVDPINEIFTPVLTGLDIPIDVSFANGGNTYISNQGGQQLLAYDENFSLIGTHTVDGRAWTLSVYNAVPEPNSVIVIALIGMGLLARTKRKHC